MKHVIYAAIGAVALVSSTKVAATCIPSNCDPAPTQYLTQEIAPPAVSVTVETSQASDGLWNYVYSVQRTGTETNAPFHLNRLVLPYYDDAELVIEPKTWPSKRTISLNEATFGSTPISIVSQQSDMPPYQLENALEQLRFTSPFAPISGGQAVIELAGNSQYIWDTWGSHLAIVYTPRTPAPMYFPVAIPGSPQAIASLVPEPGTSMLYALGLIGLVGALRRQRGPHQSA